MERILFKADLNRDVLRLKNMSRNSIEFHNEFTEILCRYGISRTTLYNELSKVSPGEYKSTDTRARSEPIEEDELKKVRQLIFEGKPLEDICSIMSQETGFSYTMRRLSRVMTILIEETDPQSTKGIDTERSIENARKFLYRLSGLDLSQPDKLCPFTHGGIKYRVPFKVLKEALDIIAVSAADSSGTANDLNEIARSELKREVLRRFRKPRDLKAIELLRLDNIRKSLHDSETSGSGDGDEGSASYTTGDIAKAVLHFAPWVKPAEIERWMKKNSGDESKG